MPRCRARSKTAMKAGKPPGPEQQCRQSAIMGLSVCRFHGGSTKAAMAAARLRLLDMIDPALGRLAKIIQKSKNDQAAVVAAKHVLDLNGFKAADKIDIHIAYDAQKLSQLTDEELNVFVNMAKKLVAEPRLIEGEVIREEEESLVQVR